MSSIANIDVNQFILKPFVDPYVPSHQLGPDYVIPTSEDQVWTQDSATRIFKYDDPDLNIEPESIVTFFRRTVQKSSDSEALKVKRNGCIRSWTFTDYMNDVRTVAKGFIKLGLIPFHGVCILGFNSPEWFISHLATIFAGGVCAGIYTTNSPESCFHVLNDCQANIAIVDNEVQLAKILRIREKLPHLKVIVQYLGKPQHPGVISWEDLMLIGQSVVDDILERRIKGLAVNQCAFLIYTSGTTGNGKGVMTSHDKIIYQLKTCKKHILRGFYDFKRSVSYLPLSHILGLACDIYLAIDLSTCVHFASPEALKGKLIDDLIRVKPSTLIGVPRVFEKIHEKLLEAESEMNFFKRQMFRWARRQMLTHHLHRQQSWPFFCSLAKTLVINKVKQKLGIDKSEFFFCGGSVMNSDMQQYFLSLDVILTDGYGLSESCGMYVAVPRNHILQDYVGNINEIPSNQVRINDPDENGCGEIMLRGRSIFMGYLNLKEQTMQSFDDVGWLYTGDLGKIEKDGRLKITGRIKELIITSGGENISPLIIEDAVKKLLPVIANSILIGDGRKFLSMLVTLKTDFDLETLQPTDALTESAILWCKSVGSESKRVSEILKSSDKKVMDAIQKGIDQYNKNEAISTAQRIQKWKILPQDFSIPNGELGPTGKMKRNFIVQKYSDIIEHLYS